MQDKALRKLYPLKYIEYFFVLLFATCLVGLFIVINQDFQNLSLKPELESENKVLVENISKEMIQLAKDNQLIINSNENHKIKTEKYNQVADSFNKLIRQTNLKLDHPELLQIKSEIIVLNNKVFSEIENTKSSLEKKGNNRQISNFSDVNAVIEKYENLKDHPSLKKTTWTRLNTPTLKVIGFFSILILSSFFFFVFSNFNRKRLTENLLQSESELKTFKSVINNMSEGVIVSDRFGFFTYYNQSALDIIGTTVKDIYYESSFDLMGFYDTDYKKLGKDETPFAKAFKKNIISDEEIYVLNKQNPDGLFISASNGFFTDLRGNTAGAVVVMKNITHKKQLEELWKKEKLVAIEASQKKSDFLATMSHEIRTPMNGIIGLSNLLNETDLNTIQKDYAQTIARSAQSLLSLINDILDHSKIEAGKVELQKSNFDLHFLLKDTLENFKYVCNEKKLDLSLIISERIDNYFIGDENRIRQIIMNLVGNAIKFTTHGRITLQLELKKDLNDLSTIKFLVNDTGPGMTDLELERLFQRFFQTKTGIQFGGTGLGLNICKQLVDLMDGEIGVESKIGEGSTFWFTIPLEKTQKESTNLNQQTHNLTIGHFENYFKGHILVAEDNLINQKVISQYLSKIGCTFDISSNGKEALDFFSTQSYDLVLMDCNMPVMDGFTATQKMNALKTKENINSKTPVVALTAEGAITGFEKCIAAGMNDFINKPILINEFITVLKKYLPIQKQTPTIIENNILNNLNINEALFKLKDLKSGDQLLIEVLFEDFKETAPSQLITLNKAILNKDPESVHDISHTLKSVCGTFGAAGMSDLCSRLENNPDLSITEQIILFDKLAAELKISLDQIELDINSIKDFNKNKAAA